MDKKVSDPAFAIYCLITGSPWSIRMLANEGGCFMEIVTKKDIYNMLEEVNKRYEMNYGISRIVDKYTLYPHDCSKIDGFDLHEDIIYLDRFIRKNGPYHGE